MPLTGSFDWALSPELWASLKLGVPGRFRVQGLGFSAEGVGQLSGCTGCLGRRHLAHTRRNQGLSCYLWAPGGSLETVHGRQAHFDAQSTWLLAQPPPLQT